VRFDDLVVSVPIVDPGVVSTNVTWKTASNKVTQFGRGASRSVSLLPPLAYVGVESRLLNVCFGPPCHDT